jgi:hypothetical protein
MYHMLLQRIAFQRSPFCQAHFIGILSFQFTCLCLGAVIGVAAVLADDGDDRRASRKVRVAQYATIILVFLFEFAMIPLSLGLR